MNDKRLENTILTLFFTYGKSLKTWADVGSLDRELELYKRLAKILKEVNIVTYGGRKDKLYIKSLGEINLLSITWYPNLKWTILNLLLRYLPQIYKSSILKTNQIKGSEVPLWFKKRFGKKLIVRCGYLYSYFEKKQSKNKKIISDAIRLERDVFLSADISIVTSSWQRNIVIKSYNIKPEKIRVIPNYVITDVFKPHPGVQKKYDLIFVGRAGSQKNIGNLLKAIQYLKKKGRSISLLMVGGCCYDNEIKETVDHYALDVTFRGNVPNFDLPHILNQAKVFILPSYYEGHPKTLLEAMSCGLPCIGSDVVGIREDIEHMKTGYLCKTDYESIANAIETVLSDESLQNIIGNNAWKYILKRYAIDRILRMELDVIKEVISK
ncbi:MAG: glycosyltransferase family 4 protein [Candidatus Methylarchaceae archaeon HK01B]|nr:glycosyltransferase family 4 protein [Candidatus Methylarchaceae archaeon HK02M1]MCP8319031.1 glycosyltransferase family 4 protein [Candidatus Methylarchaceae archaeon HK01B]